MNITRTQLSEHLRSDGLEGVEARVGLRIASMLNERRTDSDHAIAERLRVAREQAVARARQVRLQTAPSLVRSGQAAALTGGPTAWWQRLAMGLPLLVLVGGLVAIDEWHARAQIQAAAEVDSALLSGALPPDAYRDAGFLEFLKSTPHEPSPDAPAVE